MGRHMHRDLRNQRRNYKSRGECASADSTARQLQRDLLTIQGILASDTAFCRSYLKQAQKSPVLDPGDLLTQLRAKLRQRVRTFEMLRTALNQLEDLRSNRNGPSVGVIKGLDGIAEKIYHTLLLFVSTATKCFEWAHREIDAPTRHGGGPESAMEGVGLAVQFFTAWLASSRRAR